ncbi:MAG: purine phosphorylase [Sphingobium sp.]|nr:purine phosphorylase [Sphingobium sp.]
MRIGIITGVEEEAAAFLPGEGTERRVGPYNFRLLNHAGHDIAIACCGVGKVNAALAGTLMMQEHQADILMIIGTAGKLSDKVGDCFRITEALQGDFGAHRPTGFTHYTAGSWPIGPAEVEAFTAFALPDIGLPVARIITGDSFVECPDHSLRLRNALEGDLVDMETGALAQVAALYDVPWAAIKATTDDANGESVGDFQTNLLLAARRAAQAAEQSIRLL